MNTLFQAEISQSALYFSLLQNRLIARLKTRIQNGDFTERGLALLTGISQPHIHNVLKGTRMFSHEIADRVLRKLDLSLLDLLEEEELRGLVVVGGERRYREIPVLDGVLGPGLPLPSRSNHIERFAYPISKCASLVLPAFVRLAKDERMAGVIRENDLALLDHSTVKRTALRPQTLYVVHCNGEGTIRRASQGQNCLFLLTDNPGDPEYCERVSLADCHLLDIVKAKVVWIGRMLE